MRIDSNIIKYAVAGIGLLAVTTWLGDFLGINSFVSMLLGAAAAFFFAPQVSEFLFGKSPGSQQTPGFGPPTQVRNDFYRQRSLEQGGVEPPLATPPAVNPELFRKQDMHQGKH